MMDLSPEQEKVQFEFQDFVARHVAPFAARIDREESLPREVLDGLRGGKYLAFGLPENLGGRSVDPMTQGLLHEALGWGSASVQGLVNVHQMASTAIARWGSASQKAEWMPELASGRCIAAFAVTEPNVGSDAKNVETSATRVPGGYRLDGQKRWISCAQVADVFVLLARADEGPTTFLVRRDLAGLSISPIGGMLGCRGYMLGELGLEGCVVAEGDLLGRRGTGFSHVAAGSLTLGRFNLAWACNGIARACINRSVAYTTERRQFGCALREFELIQGMLARMITQATASRLLCVKAAESRASRSPRAPIDAAMAKYFASTVLQSIASDAVQIHGACGCNSVLPFERMFRDAKIMEIIEGTTQVLESLIARNALSYVDEPPSAP